MPVRKPRQHGLNNIGAFQSIKLGRTVRYESTIERDACYLFDFDPTILSYEEQPFVISVTTHDATRRYTPDFLVIQEMRSILVECKPTARITSDETLRQIDIGHAWARETGNEFVLITDTDIRRGHLLSNVKLLWRYGRLLVPILIIDRCQALLATYPEGLPLLDIATELSEGEEPFLVAPYLYSLLYHHHLHTDLLLPLSLKSHIWLESEAVTPPLHSWI